MAEGLMEIEDGNFESEVLQSDTPVLVDFWAPWCGPCKVLKPILEKLAAEYDGRFRLAKINSDENQEIAAAFSVRSIPDVMAFRDGQPVSHFLGAQPESQVRAFIESILPKPSEIEQARAAALRAAGDLAGATGALQAALELDPANDPARLDLAELYLECARPDEAEGLLEQVRPNVDWDARVEALRAAVSFARTRASGANEGTLKTRLNKDPADHAARFELSELHAGAHRYREALDELIEIVRRDKDWNNGAARKQVLNIFNLAENDSALVSEYRKKFASALY